MKAAEAYSDSVTVDPQDHKAVRRMIFKLAGPSLTEMLLINMTQMVMMILVGHLGAVAVAAVGLTSQPYMLMTVLFAALNTGTTVIVARSTGAGNRGEANRAAGQSLMLGSVLSVLIVALGILLSEEMLRMMGASPEVVHYGLSYARLMFLSIGFSAISSALSAILRGAGDTRTPMKINVLSGCLSISLGFVLIYGHLGLPEMGVAGAAIATLAVQAMAMIAFLVVMFSGKFAVRIGWAEISRLDKNMIYRMLRIGIPSSLEQLIMRLGIMTFVKICAGLGTVAVAASQIVTSIIGISFMPGAAFAIAASTLVGQTLGVGKPDLAERYVWQIRKYGMLLGGVMGAVFILFAPYIFRLYTSDATIIREGAWALRIVGFIQISQISQFILGGALRGAGDTRFPLYSTLIGVWGVRVMLSYLFVYIFSWGMFGLWSAVACDQFLRSNLIYFRFKRMVWKQVKI
ncbi:MATE family efflux transporter [Paenibacillus sp. CGMCC 1.16610]|uniref:Probable multidrug resistance protein NorM n=1 Tax=Paenibacillus anseongense TaxID=2682845 RepID=A0ABW9U8H9_9BACL|nr:MULTISPECIES: MATE family efflux transporter [Paenibacillus]MBA2940312.1 MATE family efflux transporter [Paenibacillus sp. CGMCC 1.16610]MVQ35489.1 MATE family efflux transporter [Paenibacillus anseongense]